MATERRHLTHTSRLLLATAEHLDMLYDSATDTAERTRRVDQRAQQVKSFIDLIRSGEAAPSPPSDPTVDISE